MHRAANDEPSPAVAGEVAAQGEFARGWKPLLAASVGVGLGLSPMPAFTSGIFGLALEHEFGWSRSAVLLSSALLMLSLFLFGPYVGRLTDRIGARPVAIWSTIGLGVTTMMLSLVTHAIWTYYLLFWLMTVAALGTLPITYARVINTWFFRYRGLALGISLCTTGVSGMILPIYVQTLIMHYGWRVAYLGLGLLPLVITLPCIVLLLPRTEPVLTADNARPDAVTVTEGVAIRVALGDRRYWIMAATVLIAGLGVGGTVVNLVPLLIDHGFAPLAAASLFGFYGLSVIVGRILSGWLLDRFWAPAVGAAFLLCPALGTAVMGSTMQGPALLSAATFLVGLASGAEFDLMAYMLSRYFGRRNFSALYSGQYAAFALGAGTAPAIFGGVHDRFHTYTPILHVVSVLFLVAAALLLALGRYPRFEESSAVEA
jgi:MFS family permease